MLLSRGVQMSEKNTLVNNHVKKEFKRFFEYVFKAKPEYWQGVLGWEVLGKNKTPEEGKLYNKLVSAIVQAEESLKRIINDASLNSAKELKYYAYLFLKDMDKAGEIQEPQPPEVIGVYDNPSKLIDTVKDSSKPADVRQKVLERIKELMPFNKLPAALFDKGVFNNSKWENIKREAQGKVDLSSIDRDWLRRAAPEIINGRWDYVDLYIKGWIWHRGNTDNLKEFLEQDVYAIRNQADQDAYNAREQADQAAYNTRVRDHQNGINARKAAIDAEWNGIHGDLEGRWGGHYQNNTPYGRYTDSLWNWYSSRPLQDLEAGGGWTTLGWQVPAFYTNGGLDFLNNLDARVRSNRRRLAEWNSQNQGLPARTSLTRTPTPRGAVDNGRIATYWQAYRKEQDEEYPSLLAQYEKEMGSVNFADAALTKVDFSSDINYLFLKNKLGEARANELWNSPEQLLKAIAGKFSGEYKNIFAARLYDLTIVTLDEQKRVIAGLLDVHEDMFFGDNVGPVPLVDTDKVTIVDKSVLDGGENKTNAKNVKEDL